MLLRFNILGDVELDNVRPLLCLLHIAADAAGVHDEAVFAVAVRHGVDTGQFFIVDFDQLDGRSRVRRRIRDNQRQMVAEKPYLIRAKDRLLRRPCADLIHAGNVSRRHDAHHTFRLFGGGVVHRVDLCVRRRRPDKRTVQQGIRADVLSGEVVAEFQFAAGLVHAVYIPDRLADCGTGDFGHDLIFPDHNNRAFVAAEAVNIRIFPAQPHRCQLDRLDNLDIAGAAAVVVFQSIADFRLGRSRMVQQQRFCRHYHARCAEAALHGADIKKRVLNHLQHGVVRCIFDGLDGFAVQSVHERHARACQPAVHQYAARAAVTGAAGFFCALHALYIAEIFEQGAVFTVLHFNLCAIERKSYHGISPSCRYLIFALMRMKRL